MIKMGVGEGGKEKHIGTEAEKCDLQLRNEALLGLYVGGNLF